MDSCNHEEGKSSHSRRERSGLTARGKLYAEPTRQRANSLDERTISTYMGYRSEFVEICAVQQYSGESQYALIFAEVIPFTSQWIKK